MTRDTQTHTAPETGDRIAPEAGQALDLSALQAQMVAAVSQQIDGMARQLLERPLDEVIDDAAVFARRNPLLVLGGAAILGFAAARFLKAEPPAARAASENPWSSDGGAA